MTWEQFLHNNFLIKLLAAIVELMVGYFLGPFIKKQILRLHNRKGVDEGVLTFTGSFANIFIRILAVIVALGQIGVDMSVAVGAFSALGLGISLALKDNMANVAGGLEILVTKPFKVGDYIACDSLEGTVQTVEIMFTTLVTFDNQEVVIPNATLIANPVTNYSALPTRRIVILVPLSIQDNYEAFRKDLLEVLQKESGVLADPAPKTIVGDYTPDGMGIQIKVLCYCQTDNYWDVLADLKDKIEQLRKANALNPPVDLVQVLK